MPFYEYECQSCKFYTEVLQKISDAPLTRCPSCGQEAMKKLISAPVFRLKGSGWYETDFKSDQENKRNLAGAEKEEAKAESKPAEAATTESKPAKPAEVSSTPSVTSGESKRKGVAVASKAAARSTGSKSAGSKSASSKSKAKAPGKAKSKTKVAARKGRR
jgi:putative FmdB family regulatory protein